MAEPRWRVRLGAADLFDSREVGAVSGFAGMAAWTGGLGFSCCRRARRYFGLRSAVRPARRFRPRRGGGADRLDRRRAQRSIVSRRLRQGARRDEADPSRPPELTQTRARSRWIAAMAPQCGSSRLPTTSSASRFCAGARSARSALGPCRRSARATRTGRAARGSTTVRGRPSRPRSRHRRRRWRWRRERCV